MADISNQYAAMPSLHIGWATWSAIALWPLLHRWWLRAAVLAYPLVTLLVIIVTANHYWIDAVGGLVDLRRRGDRRLGDPPLEPGPPRPGLASANMPAVRPVDADTAEIMALVLGRPLLLAALAPPGHRPPRRSTSRRRRSTSCSPSDDRSCSPTPAARTAIPGSTMYAFRSSVAAGVDVLDLNVTLSADDVLVVQHDLTVDRTTNGTGAVAELTFAELARPRQRLLVHRRLRHLHRPARRRLRPPRRAHR